MSLVNLSRRALLAAFAPQPKIQLALDPVKSQLRVESTGKQRTAFHFGNQWPKPFLYPLLSPSGTVLTRGFPVEARTGESDDHGWHRGLWLGHGDINSFDFWREIKPENTGRIQLVSLPRIDGAAFHADAHLLAPGRSAPLATLGQTWRFSWQPSGFVIDAVFEYGALRDTPLRFGDTDDGGFGLRLRDEFREDRGAVLSNSEGGRGAAQLWGKSARWVDYSGSVGGRPCGVTMFDNPANLRYPTAWHARPYGLNAANPFANRSFNGKSAPGGEYELPASGKLRLAYRVLLHDGADDIAALEREAKRPWR